MKINPKVTLELVQAAVERHDTTLDDPGFCVACGHECDGVEPDAREYECEVCGCHTVYGAEELFMEMVDI